MGMWAARGGGAKELLDREPRSAVGLPVANYWQGILPDLNSREDGNVDRAPVGCFPGNDYGLQDMIGNVWEWTSDPYRGARQTHGNDEPDLTLPLRKPERQHPEQVFVTKGGSILCLADYCARCRATARKPHEPQLCALHLGFRIISF